MNDYSRGYFAVQFPMDADKEQVRNAISRISKAFGLDDNDTSKQEPGTPATPDTSDAPAAPDTPSAPAPQVTPTQIANAELDKDGLPWDARIHAGTKTKTQKGIWTRKKGVADSVFDAVVAELRQQYPAAAASAPATATPPAVTTPGAAAGPTISVPTPAPATPYAQLVDWLARNTGEGKQLTPEWVNEQFSANGTSLAALAGNQELAAAWLEQFKSVGAQLGLGE